MSGMSSPTSQAVTPTLTDDELLVALDNTLADYVLVCRYPSSNTPKAGDEIRDRISELSQEMASRGMTYSHGKAAAARRASGGPE